MKENNVITKKLIDLQRMGLPALKAKFKELYGYDTTICHTSTLRKRLAFRIQELYYGGLTEAQETELTKIASTDPLAQMKPRKPEPTLLPGSRLTRLWRGKNYEVTVCANGRFSYQGRIFRSLSGVATEITGSHWNGKIFFGVR